MVLSACHTCSVFILAGVFLHKVHMLRTYRRAFPRQLILLVCVCVAFSNVCLSVCLSVCSSLCVCLSIHLRLCLLQSAIFPPLCLKKHRFTSVFIQLIYTPKLPDKAWSNKCISWISAQGTDPEEPLRQMEKYPFNILQKAIHANVKNACRWA